MSDEEGRDGKRRGGERRPGSNGGARGGRDGGAGRDGGDAKRGKPFKPRAEGTGGEGKDARRSGPFKPRAPGGDGPATREGKREGKPDGFKPRSFGMRSHAGRDADGAPKKPRSYGRITPGEGDADGTRPRPRSFSDRPGGRSEGGRDRPGGRSEGGRDRPTRGEGTERAAPRRSGPRDGEGNADGARPRARSFSDRPGGRSEGGRDRPGGRSEGGRDRPARGEGTERAAPRRPAPETETMRIAKRLARAGIASRRDAEGMIADGRVRLNGQVLQSPAIDVAAADVIEVDGVPLPPIERTRLWLFHKPAGLVTTNRDPEGRATVFDRLPEDMPRVLTVGRLDINTEGLLLLTNDGGLARTLELPATGWLRRYRVRAHGEVKQEDLDALRQGIAIDGVFYGAIEATLDRSQGSNVWLTVGLREGKNREVKRILGHLGLDVNRLIRLSFGPFQLGELAEGAVMEVKGRTLRDQLGERLIEEAGANFDAPIVNPFSNKPVRSERKPDESSRAAPREEWIRSEGERVRPNRKRADAAHREETLSRLDTSRPGTRAGGRFADRQGRDDKRGFGDRPSREGRPSREDRPGRDDRPAGRREGRDDERRAPARAGGKGFERSDDKPERKAPRPGAGAPRRAANVWMAPGARAGGPRKRSEKDGEGGERGYGPRSDSPRSEGPRKDGFRKDGPRKDGPRGAGPSRPRPDGDKPRSGPRSGPRGPRSPRG
ncbi:pseudouridine synthase [Aureimonas frigidaquae]|uniref:pseudouridine synthase n=1 Tax=Aureimonas frigidaquae TaxID=424757 RepID=UPI0009FA3ACD|nr:pseudouridine synthase [Aureimonas frigidaquae]